jgi:cation diffusion facilitator CzcD-associated flavoprotein CzcO
MQNKKNRDPSVVVIGAGMTGILMAIKLREAGITNLTILEKTERIGGTWRENTYPGVACDVPAHMYTYSFEPNPDWTQLYASGAEIYQYFEKVGRKYGVTNTVRFNEAVTGCDYDNGQWTVTTSKGDTIIADFVVNSTGILHHPVMPKIDGLDTFEGIKFHTAQWNHDVDLADKKVGIIGTGSTAAQVIPEVAKRVAKLTVFQRTPNWFLPFGNKDFSDKFRAKLRKNPNAVRRLRAAYIWTFTHFLTKAVTGHPIQNFFFRNIAKAYHRFGIKNAELRKKLTPDFKVGCKRVVINTTFFPAMQRDNVELVTDGISEITPTGVKTKDGRDHELDVLILSTGFNPTAFMRPMNMTGRDGLKIDNAWENKIHTYRSLFLPNFPNFFLMLGPNTPIGNFSVIAMSEVQCGYILKVIDRWRKHEFDEIDVEQSTAEKFGAYMKEGMKNTVWLGGCQSWYLDKDGDPILWPYTWGQWEKEMDEPEMEDFVTTSFG